jgi:hypothetical protein
LGRTYLIERITPAGEQTRQVFGQDVRTAWAVDGTWSINLHPDSLLHGKKKRE